MSMGEGGDSLKVLVKEKCKRKSSNKDIKKKMKRRLEKFSMKFKKKKERESDLILYIYTQLVYACLGLGLFL